jgi:hypothetical protein
VEPFFLRCETCQARLRVRDERFLGQIQSCPKCGSMVHIVAPAGWLTASEAAVETAPEISEVATAAQSSAGTGVVTWVQEHAILCASGAAVTVIACGLTAFLALRGDEQVAALPQPTPTVESVESITPVEEAVAESNSDMPPAAAEATTTESVDVVPAEPTKSVTDAIEPMSPEESQQAARAESSFLPLVSLPEPSEPTPRNEPVAKPEEPRTLTLEPIAKQTAPVTAITSVDPQLAYPPATEAPSPDAQPAAPPPTDTPPPAADSQPDLLASPARRTNVMDQLSMPIDSINLPEMPIGEFVNLMSGMTAVPIELDAKVLGEVGLSSRSTVTVHGEATTAGKLLARVLKEHHLTCIQREGTLVVVRAKRQ